MATGLGTKLTSASGLETPPSDSESAVSVCPIDNGDCSVPVPSEENEDPNRHEIFDTLASTILPKRPLIPDEKGFIFDVVKKVLTGTSRLLVMTASDSIRWLCFLWASYCHCRQFQLPVPILFISPLVALVQKLDTLFQNQNSLRVCCLYESKPNIWQIMTQVKNGKVDVLLLTPKMLEVLHCASQYELPHISLACIDNVECVVEVQAYQHTYLRLNKLLRGLGVKHLLGLSALATETTTTSVMEQFEFKDLEVIPGCHSPVIPRNIQLRVCASRGNKDEKLVKLFEVLDHEYPLKVIVVCDTVYKAEAVSEMLQQRLSSFSTRTESADVTDTETDGKRQRSGGHPVTVKRRKLTVVKKYVYTMPLNDQKRVRVSFERNEINVIVTTHAFGMGLPRADVIIYYKAPQTYESLMKGVYQVPRRRQQGLVYVLLDEQEDSLERFCNSTMNIPFNRTIEKQVMEIFKGRFERDKGISDRCLGFILVSLELAGHLELAGPISDCCHLKRYDCPEQRQLKQICKSLREGLVKQAISRVDVYEQLLSDLSSGDNGLEDRIARKFSARELSPSTSDESYYTTQTATTQESIASTHPLQQRSLQDSTAAGPQTDDCSQVTAREMPAGHSKLQCKRDRIIRHLADQGFTGELAEKLQGAEMITRYIYDKVGNVAPGVVEVDRATVLFKAVLSGVELNPANYDKFINILKEIRGSDDLVDFIEAA